MNKNTKKNKELNIYNPIRSSLKFRGKNQNKTMILESFLQYILTFPLWKVLYQRYGVNKSLSFYFCTCLGFSPSFLYCEIRFNTSLYKISIFFDTYKYLFDYELKKKTIENLAIVITIMSYRGSRHRNKFPTRGQRTRSNYKTSKKYHKNWLLEFKNFIK